LAGKTLTCHATRQSKTLCQRNYRCQFSQIRTNPLTNDSLGPSWRGPGPRRQAHAAFTIPEDPCAGQGRAVTGIVGAAGGLGGYFPPLVMGLTYDETDHSYTIGLVLLCITAVIALAFTFVLRRRSSARALAPA
jgi:nitrate/nitrite transporter NarK